MLLPFPAPRFYIASGMIIAGFLLGFVYPTFAQLALLVLFILAGLLALDGIILYSIRTAIHATRQAPERLSNGDPNPLKILVQNNYSSPIHLEIIDELPKQLQIRDFGRYLFLGRGAAGTVNYSIRPVERGEYYFGNLNLFARSPLQLLQRRFRFEQPQMLPVYPSFIQMRRYELLAISNRLSEAGIKKIRRVGHTMEFDRIREYVAGDDIRTINWKATARRSSLMVNNFEDERSQQVYCVLNMGRVMRMPFNGLSLLDYSINAALVLSNIAINKQDKAGIITFSRQLDAFLPAQRHGGQMQNILELLYRQDTQFPEPDYQLLFLTLLRRLHQRSLILLFSNFETLSDLKRQLPALQKISRKHLLVVIFFENTELQGVLESPQATVEGVYFQTIAERFAFDKRQIVKELQRHGIHSILSSPQQLTVNTINKYLNLKARGLI